MLVEVMLKRDGAKFPGYAKDLDAGADVFLPEDVVIQPGINMIPLGIGVKIPQGFEGVTRPRSGAANKGIITLNPPIDPGYTGEIHAFVLNVNKEPVEYKAGQAICQLVVTKTERVSFVHNIVNDRQNGKCGSTGH